MSLSAIQDNLLKTNLVQQTQSKGDDVARGQENAVASVQKEDNRKQDQVVLSTHETEQQGIRDDEEKQRGREEKDEEEENEENSRRQKKQEEEKEDEGPRARMRTINVVI